MPDREKVIKGLETCTNRGMKCNTENCPYWGRDNCLDELQDDALELLKEQEDKPLRCKECGYHRNDGWCNEHGREVKESDYCSFGAWEGR